MADDSPQVAPEGLVNAVTETVPEPVAAFDPVYFDAAQRLFGYPEERRVLSVKDLVLIDIALTAPRSASLATRRCVS